MSLSANVEAREGEEKVTIIGGSLTPSSGHWQVRQGEGKERLRLVDVTGLIDIVRWRFEVTCWIIATASVVAWEFVNLFCILLFFMDLFD